MKFILKLLSKEDIFDSYIIEFIIFLAKSKLEFFFLFSFCLAETRVCKVTVILIHELHQSPSNERGPVNEPLDNLHKPNLYEVVLTKKILTSLLVHIFILRTWYLEPKESYVLIPRTSLPYTISWVLRLLPNFKKLKTKIYLCIYILDCLKKKLDFFFRPPTWWNHSC